VKKRHWIIVTAIIIATTWLTVASGCATSPYPISGEMYLVAATQVAQATQVVIDATADAVQATADAKAAIAQATSDAREEWEFQQRQTTVASTAMAEAAHATSTAMAEIAQATGTAQAHATATAIAGVQATETAWARATSTAQAEHAATQTAAPILTQTAREDAVRRAEDAARLERLKWERRLAPLTYVAELLFWGLLVAIGLVTLIWGIPRLFNVLAVRCAAWNTGSADKPMFFFAVFRGFLDPWLKPLDVGAYDPDRDKGPGQIIDVSAPGMLPGDDPATTARDQAIDLVTRPVEARHRHALGPRQRYALPRGYAHPRQLTHRWMMGTSRIPGIRSIRTLRHLRQAEGLLPPALLTSLETDWEDGDEGSVAGP
jgi:hypothetical protein